jgi:pilus assembly protein TadC
MKPRLFLRIASVLTFIHCVLHTLGGVFGSPQHGAEEIAIVDAMKSRRFDVLGSMRSYWDFFFGYGLFVTLALLVEAILLWQLAIRARANPDWVRPIAALLLFNFAAMSIVSWRYFFIAPAMNEVLIAAFIAIAIFAPATT